MTKVQTLIEEILINNAEGSYARRLALEAHMEINNDLKVIVRVPGLTLPFSSPRKTLAKSVPLVGQATNQWYQNLPYINRCRAERSQRSCG